MGLLEKALQYKKEINSRGGKTLIDKIQGPAETEIMRTTDDGIRRKSDKVRADAAVTNLPGGDVSMVTDDELFKLPGESSPVKPDAQPEADDEPVQENKSAGEISRPRPEVPGEIDPLTAEDEPPVLINKLDLQGLDETQPGGAKLREQNIMRDTAVEFPEIGDNAARHDFTPDEKQGPENTAIPGQEKFDRDKFRSELPERIGQTTRHNKKFHDFMVLYEIGKEIVRAETRSELYDVILFSVMGQIGTSSASIIIPEEKDPGVWTIVESRGIVLKNKQMPLRDKGGILSAIIGRREIIDLDEYKNLPEFEEEYFRLISIDARLLCPLTTDGRTPGVIVVGEKITIGDYTDAEKDFMVSIAEIAAMVFRKIATIEELQKFSISFKEDIGLNSAIGELMNGITRCVSVDSANALAREELAKLGLSSYALFIRAGKNDAFVPVLTEKEDRLGLVGEGHTIPLDHPLVPYLLEMKEGSRISAFQDITVIRNSFTEPMLRKMSQFWVFPYKSGGNLLGFMTVFHMEEKEYPQGLHLHLDRLSKLLISYTINMRSLGTGDAGFVDTIDPVIRRLQKSFNGTKDLGIPFTLVMLSIKNFKRYHSLYGNEDANALIERCEKTISSRLSDSDYAVRVERNKILIVLPGKNKKFAITLANTIRNEIGQLFHRKEMQLMLMYLTAEYPEDGEDVFALLDAIE
ncbi:MAG: diguanylate cyclase [Spirochaetes bacterium]|nr:MAG: diguanylate cyclase [Spirochaetota bacterium]